VQGYQPGAAGFPLSQIYVPAAGGYTDPVTGINAPYYVICQGCARPSGVGNVVFTTPNYQIYQGLDVTANKRFSQRWQMSTGFTLQSVPQHFPTNSPSFTNPTGREFQEGNMPTGQTGVGWLIKANGAYQFGWDITAAANFNAVQGQERVMTINGPGSVYGGVNSSGAATTISYTTLEFQERDKSRFATTKLLDLSLQKSLRFRGGKNRVKLSLDAFNVFNINTITGFASNNLSLTTNVVAPSTIVPPRVFRVGASLQF
jgi:hypothetical protein